MSRSGVAGVRGVAGLREAGLSGVVMPGAIGIARPLFGSVTGGTLTDADLATWLAQPERPGVRADVQFAWSIRAILTEWASHPPASAVTSSLLQQLFTRLTTTRTAGVGFAAGRLQSMRGQSVPTSSWLRASSLTLADTVYEPPGDRGLIESCFRQLLAVSGAIADPVERAFFLLTHLLYLLPFERCNATMALLTMNAPLIAAGLKPVTFTGVAPSDLLAGIRAVWELNRTELLRDAFGAAP